MTWGPLTQWELLLENRSDVSYHPGQGCISNPNWVDTDNLIRWKYECLSLHGTKCENPLNIWHIRPAWLIDVQRKCLVRGSSIEGPFVALSYTYGRNIAFNIDTNMLVELQVRLVGVDFNVLTFKTMSEVVSAYHQDIQIEAILTDDFCSRHTWN